MKIWIDGSAHPNPGPGGFGIVICDDNNNLLKTFSKQYDKQVTNNQMELLGLLISLNLIANKEKTIIYSDSAYVVNIATNWIYSWEARGWIKADKKIPENLDILKNLYNSLIKTKNYVIIEKIKGHQGIEMNELADKLATGKVKGDIKL